MTFRKYCHETKTILSKCDKVFLIQVTSDVGHILKDLGWSVECRGEIDVKGKGRMVTYFVDPRSFPKPKLSIQVSPTETSGRNSKHSKDSQQSADLGIMKQSWKKKTSLSSLKSMLDSRKGTFDVVNEVRRSLPITKEGVIITSAENTIEHPSYLTLPKNVQFVSNDKRIASESNQQKQKISMKNDREHESDENKNSFHLYDKETLNISDTIRTKYYSSLEEFNEGEEVNYPSKLSNESK